MNAGWNQIAKSIFERPDVENISLEELDFLVEEYPYFPVIHFLRTRKLLADQVSPTLSGVARTALYFPNPHWLNHQLEGIPITANQESSLSELLTTPTSVEELKEILPEESILPEAELIQEETETVFDDKRIFDAGLETFPTEAGKEEISADLASDSVDLIETEMIPEPEIEVTEVAQEIEIAETETLTEEKEISETVEAELPQELYEPEFKNPEESYTAELASEQTEPEIVDDVEDAEDSGRPEFQLPPLEMPAEPGGEALEIPIEPLYTIDYFASQGIKLKLEEEPTDKLSIKLRSFTDWLKAMKKIHPEKLDHKMGQEEENSIRVYAETSNEPKEVYTEALAEVYLQQGLHQKAVLVFEKLSLLDPSKSAYFAARIREIKEI